MADFGLELAGNLAAGLGGAYKGYTDAQDRELKRKAQEDEAAYRKQMLELSMADKGLLRSQDGGFVYTPEKQAEQKAEREVKEAQVQHLKSQSREGAGRLRGQYGLIDPEDPYSKGLVREKGFKTPEEKQFDRSILSENLREQRELRKNQLQSDRDRQKFSVPGYEMSPETPLSSENQKALLNASSAQKRTDALIQNMKKLIASNEGGKFLPGGKRKELKQVYEDLKVELKEAANLGALAGADVKILEGQMIDPTSLEANTLYSKDELLKNYQSLSDNLKTKLAASAEARGYRPSNENKGLLNQESRAKADRARAVLSDPNAPEKAKVGAQKFLQSMGQ